MLEENKIDIGLIGKPEHLRGYTFDYLSDIEDAFVATPEYLDNTGKIIKNPLAMIEVRYKITITSDTYNKSFELTSKVNPVK